MLLMPALLESVNSVKNPTSSSPTPTVTTSAPPATQPTKTVTINDGEEVVVGADTEQLYYANHPDAVADSVFKCAKCQIGTIHQGYAFDRRPTENHRCIVGEHEHPTIVTEKRVYMCTNCGRFSLK